MSNCCVCAILVLDEFKKDFTDYSELEQRNSDWQEIRVVENRKELKRISLAG